MITLQKAKIENFYDVYENYMLKQFPLNELKSCEDFVNLLSDKDKKYNLYLAKQDRNTVGYALFYISEDFIWVDYIAVMPKFYSKGYGKTIIELLCTEFNNTKGLYFEVEKPDENDINTIKRIKFYKNNNAKKLDFRYFYPHKKGLLEMDLYYIAIKKQNLDKNEIFNDVKKVFENIHFTNSNRIEALEKMC